VKVNLVSQSKSIHFNLIQRNPPETEFYLVGWGVPTYDSDYIFSYMYHSRTGSQGSWNATGFKNAEIDMMIESLSKEVDLPKRDATIAKLWTRLKDETIYRRRQQPEAEDGELQGLVIRADGQMNLCRHPGQAAQPRRSGIHHRARFPMMDPGTPLCGVRDDGEDVFGVTVPGI
jgi:hypothetical protein